MSWVLLQNTLILGLGVSVLAAVAATSVLIFSLALPRSMAEVVSVVSAGCLLLPQFLAISIWMEFWGGAGVGAGAEGWLYSLPGAILLLSSLLWPIPFFFLLMRRDAILRASLGVDPFVSGYEFVFLIWQQVRVPLFWGSLFVFALAVNNLSVPGLLQVRVIAEEILVRFNTELNLAAVSQLAWPLAGVALCLCWHAGSWEWSWEPNVFRVSDVAFRQRMGLGWGALFLLLGTLVLVVSFGLPLAYLVLSPSTWTDLIPAFLASSRAIWFSFLFAALTASVVLGAGGLLVQVRWSRYSWVLFVVPGTLLGAYFAVADNALYSLGVNLGILAIVLALSLRFLGLGVSGVGLALKGVDSGLVALSRLEGQTPVDRFRLCVWPQAGGSLLAVWWLIYLFCVWEVEVLIFLIPPGIETVGLRIFNLLHYGHNSQVNASCLLLILLGLAPALCWSLARAGRLIYQSRRLTLCCCGALVLSSGGCGSREREAPQMESRFFDMVMSVGFKGTGVGQFNKPRSVAVSGEGEVFAVDMTGRVQRFDRNGKYISFWQMPETERGRPKGMGIDGSGQVIVVEPHYARVNHFTSEGDLVHQWGDRGTSAGQLAFPRSVCVHSSGDLIISEFQQVERLQRFEGEGGALVWSLEGAGRGLGEFNRAEGMGIDSEDRLYVADSCNHRIQVFNEEGDPVAEYGKAGDGLGDLSYPYDVKVDGEGFQFVCEFGNSRIQVFDPAFQPVEIIGGPGSRLGEFSNPWAMAMDSEGNLWVADSGNHRLQKLVRRKVEP